MHKPQPKYGWHGQITQPTQQESSTEVVIGSRVYHYLDTAPGHVGTVIDDNPTTACWVIAWDHIPPPSNIFSHAYIVIRVLRVL